MKMKATNIKWDVTDGTENMTQDQINEILNTLPTEIDIPNELTDGEIDYDSIDDYLSNQTGFCHTGYVLIK